MRRPVALVVLTALVLAGCSDSQSPPTAGPSTVPSSSVSLPTTAAAHDRAARAPPPDTPTPTPTPTPTNAELRRPEAASPHPARASGPADHDRHQRERHDLGPAPIVQKQKPGGVLLLGSGGSLSHTRTAMAAATTAATVKGVRPLIAADQEGGQIQRLKGPGFDRIPAATVQGTWSSSTSSPPKRKEWGGQLKQAGVNVDLAPVADVVPNALKSAERSDRQSGPRVRQHAGGGRAAGPGVRQGHAGRLV